MLFIKVPHCYFSIRNGDTLLFNLNTIYEKSSIISNKKRLITSINPLTYKWCPAAESNYGLDLTMVPLYRLTSGAKRLF